MGVAHFTKCIGEWAGGQYCEAQLLTWLTILDFSSSSELWALEILCCVFWHSFISIGYSRSVLDSCRRNLGNTASDVPLGCVLGRRCVSVHLGEFFYTWQQAV